MGKFLESEKIIQVEFKKTSPLLSSKAGLDGEYKNKPRPFCLPVDLACENLSPHIRESAIAFFKAHKIKWHDGKNGEPSNHLCDSQVCCVNFLFPFAYQPQALKSLLVSVLPMIDEMLPVEDGAFVSFEWIGDRNYLGEKKAKNATRSRGANFTSADAVVRFRDLKGEVQVVLIEWKYTESYSPVNLMVAKSGTNRLGIYEHLLRSTDSPIKLPRITSLESLFYEPFYQFMRQQLLAHEMEKAGELKANTVSVLHIAPVHNIDFKRVTSSELKGAGKTAIDAWRTLVSEDIFKSIYTEELFNIECLTRIPGLEIHVAYLLERYKTLVARI